jgi:cytochrome oxidase Cu insertion factor (SCO1/SenC/PrrC family)
MEAGGERRVSVTIRLGRRALWALTAGVVVLGVGMAVGIGQRARPRQGGWEQRSLEGLQVFGTVPEFSFTERSGRRVGLADLQGKVWIGNFIYTHCTETCPIQSAQMAQLQADLRDVPGVRFVSITVEPETDTPAVLAEYARRYGADPEKWLFLTGEKAAIYRLAQEGFRLSVADPREQVQSPAQKKSPPARPGASGRQHSGSVREVLLWLIEPAPALAIHGSPAAVFIHSSRFVLVDRQARIRGYYRSDDAEALMRLRKDVRTLVRER